MSRENCAHDKRNASAETNFNASDMLAGDTDKNPDYMVPQLMTDSSNEFHITLKASNSLPILDKVPGTKDFKLVNDTGDRISCYLGGGGVNLDLACRNTSEYSKTREPQSSESKISFSDT